MKRRQLKAQIRTLEEKVAHLEKGLPALLEKTQKEFAAVDGHGHRPYHLQALPPDPGRFFRLLATLSSWIKSQISSSLPWKF
jgi:hypothetical protein